MTTPSNLLAHIESRLNDMTGVETTIANYFLEPALKETDLTSQTLSQTLHVSQAALTRFAKKCGFDGYRQFVFAYREKQEDLDKTFDHIHNSLTKRVLLDYEDITRQSYQLIDEDQLKHIAELIEKAERVYFFGQGSSGFVAREMKLRLMRLGVICEALTEQESFAWTISILDSSCLVIGFSYSGKTSTVMDSLAAAREKGAQTVLFSTRAHQYKDTFTETVALATVRDLDFGNRISPQFPMLVLLDILYAYFFDINREKKEAIFNHYDFPKKT